MRRLCDHAVDGPRGVEAQSKARQRARISPGPSNSGSEATLLVANTSEIDVVVSPCSRRVPASRVRTTASDRADAHVDNVPDGGSVRETGRMAEPVDRDPRVLGGTAPAARTGRARWGAVLLGWSR